jgi:hypothetical protein
MIQNGNHWLVAALLLFTTLTSPAQQPDPQFDPLGETLDLPKLVRVQVEFIEVPHATLTRLLMDPRTGGNDTDLRKELAALSEKGEATVVETMLVIARSGQKATVESIKEFIYPTEYEPAELPNEIHITQDGEKTIPDVKDLATGPTPTAFETRNLGSTLEIEPTIGDDSNIIDLRFMPEIVYHTGNDTWAEWKGRHGDASVRMPHMFTARINTAVTLINGRTLFVAALSPKGPDGFPDFTRKLMAFVRCDILTVGR